MRINKHKHRHKHGRGVGGKMVQGAETWRQSNPRWRECSDPDRYRDKMGGQTWSLVSHYIGSQELLDVEY